MCFDIVSDVNEPPNALGSGGSEAASGERSEHIDPAGYMP